MTDWRRWVLVVAVLALPGGLVLAAWLLKRARQDADPWIAAHIKPPSYRWTASDESLRNRTAQRRKAADGIRTRAAKVETGASVSDVLRMIKR